MRSWVLPLALAVGLAPMAAAGCGNGANGVADCKAIEDARCNAAVKCSTIQLTPPYSTNGSDSDACIRFYDTACQHGLAGNGPMAGQLTACVKAIESGSCAIVETPWNDARCSWLIPPNTPEAGVDAGAGDGDAGDAADTSDGNNDAAE